MRSSAENEARQGGRHVRLSGVPLRVARIDELDILCDIDRDASRLFERAGLDMALPNELEFAAEERRRWLDCLRSGRTLLASDRSGELVGFAALGLLDDAGYLEQLSVRMHAMRQGIGTALLAAMEEMAEKGRASALWLTTYAHLPWNKPFYERAGFSIVPEEQWGSEMKQQLVFERRLLPEPEERVVMRKALGTSTCRWKSILVRLEQTWAWRNRPLHQQRGGLDPAPGSRL